MVSFFFPMSSQKKLNVVGLIFLPFCRLLHLKKYFCILPAFPSTKTTTIVVAAQQDSVDSSNSETLLDMNDPRLMDAMEIFANMSPEEMMETMNELKGMIGDDPETIAAIQDVMKEIQSMNANDIQNSLKDLVEEDEVRVAMKDALTILKDGQWDTIWEHRNFIRDAVIDSGKISPEDAAKFKTDQTAWEEELKFIWNELQKQAAASSVEAAEEL